MVKFKSIIVLEQCKYVGLTVYGEFRVSVDFVESDSLVELHLGGDGARIAFLVDPLHGKNLVVGEAAYLSHLLAELIEGDVLVNVGDEDLAVVGHLGLDLADILGGHSIGLS